jgi:predicted amidohydrolase YtcJ
MKRLACAIAMGAMLLTAGAASAQFAGMREQLRPAEADTILENGRIYTPAGWASALAISKGAIVAVGDAAAVAPHRASSTRVIDLGGKTVLPGFHDMHVHPAGAGMEQFSCRIPHDSKPQQILDITAKCVAKAKLGEWITGRAYDAVSFGATPPHRSMLDKVAPENPVVFTDISGHSSWANSAALRIAGITRDTPNPQGGIIERDANGEPTGVFRESAAALVHAKVPPPSLDTTINALKWSLDLMLSEGITAFDDAGVSRPVAIAYSTLADRGQLKQRVRGCSWFRDPTLIKDRGLYMRDRFRLDCVKVVLDGVPTDAHTAAMVENYLPSPHAHGDGREKGLLLIPPAELDPMVTRFDAMGLTVKFHAAGDAAVREGLDAIAAARRANGFSGSYHNVGHNSFVQMDDIRRARSIGATFEFSPYIWYSSTITDGIRKAIGEERMKRWIPIKDALDAGALSVPGSDWAVVPSVSPWIALETLVTRQPPGGRGEPLGAQERITLEQAVDMFTRASARQMNADHMTGTIEAGKMADLIVIDRNIFDVPITTVHQTKVLRTFINGEEVFTRR